MGSLEKFQAARSTSKEDITLIKVTLQKLGMVEKAELELGDLTIICGENNCGKTYATYALYSALKYLRSAISVISIDDNFVNELIDKGTTVISLSAFFNTLPEIVRSASKKYSKELPRVFASKTDHFAGSRFCLDISSPPISLYKNITRTWSFGRKASWIFRFSAEKMEVQIQTATEWPGNEPRFRLIARNVVENAIRHYLLHPIVPDVYISSTERTGVVMFQRELDFTRNRLIDALGDKTRNLSSELLFSEFRGDYPVPVRENVDFIRSLQSIENNDGIIKLHPEIGVALSEIVGGTYKASKDGFITYTPAKAKRNMKLGLSESSSSVRALLDISFYLRNVAKPGDLLMIDEPELNLHPSNQRKLARLLARLVNVGVKVFMTTHSDYIVKEINTLLLLNQEGAIYSKIAEEEKYSKDELLDASKIRVYIAKKCMLKKDGNKRRSLCHSFVPARLSQETGIYVESFDKTIDEMNRIQDRILWEAQ